MRPPECCSSRPHADDGGYVEHDLGTEHFTIISRAAEHEEETDDGDGVYARNYTPGNKGPPQAAPPEQENRASPNAAAKTAGLAAKSPVAKSKLGFLGKMRVPKPSKLASPYRAAVERL